jgi:hypothetical protein
MSKLNKDAKSKLSSTDIPQEEAKKEIIIPDKIIMGKNKTTKVHTFALKANDQERIRNILKKVQAETQKKLTATDIIRGLLILGEHTDTTKMIESVKKSFLE